MNPDLNMTTFEDVEVGEKFEYMGDVYKKIGDAKAQLVRAFRAENVGKTVTFYPGTTVETYQGKGKIIVVLYEKYYDNREEQDVYDFQGAFVADAKESKRSMDDWRKLLSVGPEHFVQIFSHKTLEIEEIIIQKAKLVE